MLGEDCLYAEYHIFTFQCIAAVIFADHRVNAGKSETMMLFVLFTCFHRIVFDFYVFRNIIGAYQVIKMRLVVFFDYDIRIFGIF